ncbi:putative conjugative transfer protein TraA [Orientia tsutsugamushi str. Gilliam]|uniref:Putative conjugative transfer protein TraA n=1 Tax=Orientia tsutsugamushi str. Gilliam TaxID=1359184 RepID=A0A0F3M790_ORITS|nr:hypothetical protein [Orientia tsutsugamushi]KJV51362.1 putative conjugative transfer protein TraA [Orientia tsutsugamushi str. Gilliam]
MIWRKNGQRQLFLVKIENWFKSIINDINDRSHVNEEYYHFTAKPEQEAKVERVQQENSIKQYHSKIFLLHYLCTSKNKDNMIMM